MREGITKMQAKLCAGACFPLDYSRNRPLLAPRLYCAIFTIFLDSREMVSYNGAQNIHTRS